MLSEPIEVTAALAAILGRLGIRYLVGGSLASSLHGIPRATADVDIVADLQPKQIRGFVSALKQNFYVSEEAVREAVLTKDSFNLIHLTTMLKIDVFVFKGNALAEAEMARASDYDLDGHMLTVASAEDMILQKLAWYRLGNEVSERQWTDVLGMLKVRETLDHDYLRHSAAQMNIDSLLTRAFQAAGRTLL